MNDSLEKIIGTICAQLPLAVGCGEVWVKFAPHDEQKGPPMVWINYRYRDMKMTHLLGERELLMNHMNPDEIVASVAAKIRRALSDAHAQFQMP